MEYFDTSAWLAATQHDDWYVRLYDELQALMKRAHETKDEDEAEGIKEAVRSFFEELLVNDQLPLGGPNPKMDAERLPISQAVIHHSHRAPGYYTLPRLNAVHLLNIYVPSYANPAAAEDRGRRGTAMSSNHYHDGKMVFYGYHWWVEADGTTTRLLPDEAIGWQAGNWQINRQSIGICINDNLSHKAPTAATLESVRNILRQYDNLELLAHFQANPKTTCPGDQFLDGWKSQVIAAS